MTHPKNPGRQSDSLRQTRPDEAVRETRRDETRERERQTDRQTDRRTDRQVVLFRFRTSRNRPNFHMLRNLGPAPSRNCSCGTSEQTMEHVLQSYPILQDRQLPVWPTNTPLHTIATIGVTVSTSAFLVCHQCYCAGSSLAWGLNFRALVYGIF